MEWLKNLFMSRKKRQEREFELKKEEFRRNERRREAVARRRSQAPRPVRGTHPRRVDDNDMITNYTNPLNPMNMQLDARDRDYGPDYGSDADASDSSSSGSDSSGSDYSSGSDAGGGGFDGGSSW